MGHMMPSSAPPDNAARWKNIDQAGRFGPDMRDVDLTEPLPIDRISCGTSGGCKAWFYPGCLLFMCFMTQNFGLYIGTYYYVMWMDRLHAHLAPEGMEGLSIGVGNLSTIGHPNWNVTINAPPPSSRSLMSGNFSTKAFRDGVETLSSDVAEGSLQDVVADMLGRYSVPTAALDAMSGCMPILVFATSIFFRDLRLWSKCCLCASILAVLKGFLAWATVVPDSIGWDGCQERLGVSGLAFFRERGGLNFESEFFSSLFDVLVLEFIGIPGKRHIRFCADMMFSGHTYFCGVFACGVYDLTRSATANFGFKCRLAVRLVVGLVLAFVVCLDVTLILANRFHYTMDCTIAVVLVLLIYSNPAIALAVELYVSKWKRIDANPKGGEGDESDLGAILVPPCCFPLCWLQGRYHLHSKPDMYERFQADFVDAEQNYEVHITNLNKQLADQKRILWQSEDECKNVRERAKRADAELQQQKQLEARLSKEVAASKEQAAAVMSKLQSQKNAADSLKAEVEVHKARYEKLLTSALPAVERGRPQASDGSSRRFHSTDSGWPGLAMSDAASLPCSGVAAIDVPKEGEDAPDKPQTAPAQSGLAAGLLHSVEQTLQHAQPESAETAAVVSVAAETGGE